MKAITGALRIFLRYAAVQGLCDSRLATALRTPRMYAQESLPSGPGWTDVQRILATTETDKPGDVRNRAILMLLSIYGMRRGEKSATSIWENCHGADQGGDGVCRNATVARHAIHRG